MMLYTILISSILYLSVNSKGYNVYSEKNCGYVLDAADDKFYPLDVCITEREDGVTKSAIYQCRDDGEVVERLSYFSSDTCSGSFDSHRFVVTGGGDTDSTDVYNCGNIDVLDYNSTNSSSSDVCYASYREYSVCTDLDNADYVEHYFIMAVCLGSPYYDFKQCITNNDDGDDAITIKYVAFNDFECCDLSFKYKGDGKPIWETMDITSGCQYDGTYFGDFMCDLPLEANNTVTDNSNEECSDGQIITYNKIIMLIVGIIGIINYF